MALGWDFRFSKRSRNFFIQHYFLSSVFADCDRRVRSARLGPFATSADKRAECRKNTTQANKCLIVQNNLVSLFHTVPCQEMFCRGGLKCIPRVYLGSLTPKGASSTVGPVNICKHIVEEAADPCVAADLASTDIVFPGQCGKLLKSGLLRTLSDLMVAVAAICCFCS